MCIDTPLIVCWHLVFTYISDVQKNDWFESHSRSYLRELGFFCWHKHLLEKSLSPKYHNKCLILEVGQYAGLFSLIYVVLKNLWKIQNFSFKHTSHLFSKNSQALPQRVKSSDRTCVVISVKKIEIYTHFNQTKAWNVTISCSIKSFVLHSWRLPVTSPVVWKPTQIQEERHRLCAPVKDFLAVERFFL